MNPVIQFDKFAYLFSAHPVGVIKIETKTNAASAELGYTQVHDVNSTPANGSVPIKTWPNYMNVGDYKEFKNGELRLVNGLYIAYSTTEATLTLGTGTNKFSSIMVELFGPEVPTGTTRGTDAGVYAFTVWNQAAGLAAVKKLFQVVVSNLESTVMYLQMFTKDTPVDGNIPVAEWELAAIGDPGAQVTLTFGPDGITPFEQVAFVNRKGCTFMLSSTPTVLTTALGDGMDIVTDSK